jgi:high-affinity Fe2+/Pb2+ permease
LLKPGSSTSILLKERGAVMTNPTIIQIAAAALAVILVIILVVRRRARNK